ncbi:MAG: DUF1318 domain-containing protein [Lentisphaeria bacterium]|nr:DUF1318 domain-containing protein [Lentisphaeria bacterium]
MKKWILIAVLAVFAGIVRARATDMDDVKKRMADRLPTLNKLKTELIIGEDNQAFLAVKGDISEDDQKSVDAENADRAFVYEKIASATGASIEKVRTRRAEQIAEKSQPGLWLQKADGTWYKKEK